MAQRGPTLLASLPNLQNLIKRDPASYTDEFMIQWSHYNALRNIVEQGISTANSTAGKASSDEERFRLLVAFVAQTAACYPKHTADLPSHFSNLLLRSHANLSPDTRKTLIHSLVLLRNRGVIPGAELLKTLFPLLSMTNSSSIRAFILKTILSDVKNANAKTQNHKFNKLVQGMLYDMIERSSSATASSSKSVADYSGTGTRKSQGAADSNTGKEAMWAVKLASDLWRKGIWKDARTANLLSSACFHTNTKVQSAAMHFFLNASGSKGIDGDDSDDDSENEGDANVAMGKIRAVKHRQEINKKRRATEKAAKKEIKRANDKRKAQELKEANGEVNNQVDNSALNLLHDPQTFGERLYDLLVKNDKRFTLEHKVLIMQLFGRLSGLHKLSVLPFYSYVSKYLTYSQLSITTILVALASSVHELIPPDTLIPVIRKLAHEFVHPGVSSQVIAAGLNSIREICKRQIWAMEHDLLEDLIDYRKSKDKGIMVASRALLQLYRDQMPDMLRKRERGKTATMAAAAGKGKDSTSLQFGTDKDATTTIEGLDLLQDYLEEKRAEKAEANAGLEGADGAAGEEEDEDQDGWEVDSSASEDSETGWIAVSSDEEGGGVFDDSEDEDLRAERRAKKRARFAKPEESDESDSDSDSDEDDEATADAQDALKTDKLEVTKEEMAVLDNEKENKLALAATKILTPADFAKLNELRTAAAEEEVKAGGGGAAKRKLALLQAAKKALKASGGVEGMLTEAEIIGASKKAKADYEERMASIAKGREGREKFGSAKGKKKKGTPSSSTNAEKRKKTKAFAMVAHSKAVRGKGRVSLRAKQKRLQGHSRSQKKNAAKAARL